MENTKDSDVNKSTNVEMSPVRMHENFITDMKPFTVHHSLEELDDMITLIKLSPTPKPFYEGTQANFGVTSDWMREARELWTDRKKFNWRNVEKKMNKYPQYTTTITKNGHDFNIHFIKIESERKDATPLVLLHGWPGSFLEFYPLLELLSKSKKYHVIVPSLPGYCYSSMPPEDTEFPLSGVANIINTLMVGLGFNGYFAQGGDIGSMIARLLTHYDACRGCLVNMWGPGKEDETVGPVEDYEKEILMDLGKWSTDSGYFVMHATRPSTIAHVVSSSPVALLAWIGEKLNDWCDPTSKPRMLETLEFVTLWWLTRTFETSIYPYRQIKAAVDSAEFEAMSLKHGKPYGFSWFPKDIVVYPKSWIEAGGNCVYFARHSSGGHFAGFEKPNELAADIDGFVAAADKSEAAKGLNT